MVKTRATRAREAVEMIERMTDKERLRAVRAALRRLRKASDKAFIEALLTDVMAMRLRFGQAPWAVRKDPERRAVIDTVAITYTEAARRLQKYVKAKR